MDDALSLSELSKTKRSRPRTFARTRCKRCPIKLVHDGIAYRHVDEDFSGEKKHGHYPEPRREKGSNNRA